MISEQMRSVFYTVSAIASSFPAVMVAAVEGYFSYNWMYSLHCSARSVLYINDLPSNILLC